MAEALPQCEFESKNLILKLQKSLEGRIEAIPPFVEGLMSIVQSVGCAAGREREVEVALIEALANAVQHGCNNDPTKLIEVCVGCDESRGLLIVIRDPGPGFDPSSIPNPVVGQNLFFDAWPRHLPDQPACGRGALRKRWNRNPHEDYVIRRRKNSTAQSLCQAR